MTRFQLIRFETLYSGVLTAQGRPDGTIEMNFPATAVTALADLSEERRQKMLAALSVTEAEVLFVGSSIYDMVIEVSRSAFARLASTAINYGLLAEQGGRGVLVTCKGGARAEPVDLTNLPKPVAGARAPRADVVNDTRFDFLSRAFFPR